MRCARTFRNPKTHKSPPPLRDDEVEMSRTDQRGSVVLRHPDDVDLIEAISWGRLSVKDARKIVAARRREDES